MRIAAKWQSGGEGDVYTTNQPHLLVKLYNPKVDPGTPLAPLIEQKKVAYRTFVNVQFGERPELQCLPLSYLNIDDLGPAYLMKRADGNLLKDELTIVSQSSIRERVAVARTLAEAIEQLHVRQIVHADIKPDNFHLHHNGNGALIMVLDVDGGGYFGPEDKHRWVRFQPTAIAGKPYRSPELVWSNWRAIWRDSSWRCQPDLWALAVLIYIILVDCEGPYPTPEERKDVTIKGYSPYGARDFATDTVGWPQDWQRQLMREREVPESVIEMFVRIFNGKRCVTEGGRVRYLASEWRFQLGKVLNDLDAKEALRKAKVTILPPLSAPDIQYPARATQPLRPVPRPSADTKYIPIPGASSKSTQSPPGLSQPAAMHSVSRGKHLHLLPVLISSAIIGGLTPLFYVSLVPDSAGGLSFSNEIGAGCATIGVYVGLIGWGLTKLKSLIPSASSKPTQSPPGPSHPAAMHSVSRGKRLHLLPILISSAIIGGLTPLFYVSLVPDSAGGLSFSNEIGAGCATIGVYVGLIGWGLTKLKLVVPTVFGIFSFAILSFAGFWELSLNAAISGGILLGVLIASRSK